MIQKTTLQASVRYQGRYLGNVTITRDNADPNQGSASIDGKTRTVIYKPATQGSKKGTMQWHCIG